VAGARPSEAVDPERDIRRLDTFPRAKCMARANLLKAKTPGGLGRVFLVGVSAPAGMTNRRVRKVRLHVQIGDTGRPLADSLGAFGGTIKIFQRVWRRTSP
jgi:hypothetical protein